MPPVHLASFIDNTLLKPESTRSEYRNFIKGSLQYDFAGICIPPAFVSMARKQIDDANAHTKLVTVIGFPLGYSTTGSKLEEARIAISDGADELDMVINISILRSGNIDYVRQEVTALADLCHASQKILKLIIEVAYLNEEEIRTACAAGVEAGADFIKTSTGFAARKFELSPDFITQLRQMLPENVQIKASGGIKGANMARELIDAGATRIGTSSGLQMIQEEGA